MLADAETISVPDARSMVHGLRLPLFPRSWYLFGATRELSDRPVSENMLGREIVAFRTTGGQVVAMDARCSHVGTNLGKGTIVGDQIQCPYHGWRYGPDGRCAAIPSGCPIPDFAYQKTYAVQERHGYVFLFNGAVPSFPLPWFLDVREEGFVASRPFAFTTESAWPSVTGHAFDLQHFLFVHDRRLLEPPVIDTPAPYVRRIRYRAKIVARNWRDRLLSLAGGRTVNAALVVGGGTFAVITVAFEKFTSRFLLSMTPVDPRTTYCQGIVYGQRAARIALEVRRYFTRAYLVEAHQSLGKTASMPNRFVESAQPLGDYFRFLERTFKAGEM